MLDRIDHDGALIIGEWQRRQARIAAFDAEPVAQHNLQMAAYRVPAKRVIKALVISDALAWAFLAPSRSPALKRHPHALAKPGLVGSKTVVARPAAAPAHDPNRRRPPGCGPRNVGPGALAGHHVAVGSTTLIGVALTETLQRGQVPHSG